MEAGINVKGEQNLQINKCGGWNKRGGWKNYKCGGWTKHVEGGNFIMTFTFGLYLLSILLAQSIVTICLNVIATQM